jgi:DinB superfamily
MENLKINFIKEQNRLAREQTIKILSETPQEIWYETPDIIQSNIAWQVGHLIVSQYYHAVAVITGPNLALFNDVPLKDYFPIYSMFTKSVNNELKPSPDKLLMELDIVNKYAHKQLDTLTDADLDAALEPTRFPHPIATTKYEALTWNFRHEMWHLGQISTLKRILGHPTKW